jgi:fucose permease
MATGKGIVMNIKRADSQTVGIAFLAFVGIGLAAGLLGIAWSYIQAQFGLQPLFPLAVVRNVIAGSYIQLQFGLQLDDVNWLFLVQTIAYSLSSFYIGRLMAHFGSGTTLLAGSILMIVCLYGIATASMWALVIAFSFIVGLGNGAIDAGLNMYVATYHSAQAMNWLHASFGVGITIGPLIVTFFTVQQKLPWQVSYGIIATLLIPLAIAFFVTRRVWRNEGFQTADNKQVRRASFGETARVPMVWLGMLTYIAYVGIEIGFGQWVFRILTESRGVPEEAAAPWIGIYWGSFTVGRILFGIVANRFEIDRVLRTCMSVMIIGAALFLWNPTPAVGFMSIILLGFAQAPVFPLLMSATAKRVGPEHAENTISMQMSAVGIGTAVIPGLIGTIGKNFGLETMAVTFLFAAVTVFIFHELMTIRRAEPATVLSPGD